MESIRVRIQIFGNSHALRSHHADVEPQRRGDRSAVEDEYQGPRCRSPNFISRIGEAHDAGRGFAFCVGNLDGFNRRRISNLLAVERSGVVSNYRRMRYDLLLKLIARQRRRLRRRTLIKGERLYALRPKRFVRRVGDAYTRASRV